MTQHKYQNSALATLGVLFLACALAGCGQKGDLYLPEADPQAQVDDTGED